MDASTERSLKPHEYLVDIDGTSMLIHCPPGGPVTVDGRVLNASLVATGDGCRHLDLDGTQYRISFEGDEPCRREMTVEVNGRRVTGTVDDRRSLLRARMRGSTEGDRSGTTIKAPMPGLVLKILVAVGQDVEKGQGLLVLEAMKMENEVRSDRSGKVDAILVAERGPVEKGQPMIQLRSNA